MNISGLMGRHEKLANERKKLAGKWKKNIKWIRLTGFRGAVAEWYPRNWTRLRSTAEAWRLNLRRFEPSKHSSLPFSEWFTIFITLSAQSPKERVWNQSRSISKYLPSEAEFKLEINLNIQSKIKRVLMHERWWIGGGGLMGGFRKIFYLPITTLLPHDFVCLSLISENQRNSDERNPLN